jgi:glycosyltransferase involved in cell wall biosynthesis
MPEALHIMQMLEATTAGSRKHLRYVADGLRAAGIKVDILYSPVRADPDFAADLAAYSELGCELFPVPMQRWPAISDVPAYAAIRRILKERRPQVIHTHCTKAGLLGRLAARAVLSSAAVCHTPHAYFFEGFQGALMRAAGVRLERWLGRLTDRQICVAEYGRELTLALRIVDDPRIRVVANGLPLPTELQLRERADVRQELGIGDDTFAIGINARLAPQKLHALVLAALATLSEAQRQGLRVFCWGDGPLRPALAQQCRDSGLDGVVEFAGYVPGAEQFLVGMDLGILPSRYEGLSYQLLETLAAGVPLIATDVPGNHPAEDACPIRYVPPDAPAALAAELQRLRADATLRHDLGDRGRRWQQAHFTLDVQVAQLLAIYREAAAAKIG